MMAREQYVITRLEIDFEGSKGADEPLGVAAMGMIDDGEGDNPLRIYGKVHKNYPAMPSGRPS